MISSQFDLAYQLRYEEPDTVIRRAKYNAESIFNCFLSDKRVYILACCLIIAQNEDRLVPFRCKAIDHPQWQLAILMSCRNDVHRPRPSFKSHDVPRRRCSHRG